MQQADDFVAESEALHGHLAPLDDAAFATVTQFKGWTIDDVVRHLHFFNQMVDLALLDPAAFEARYQAFEAGRAADGTMTRITERLLDGLSGQLLLAEWRERYLEMGPRWRDADPKARVRWVGPDMSARSSITARQMETWAHGQEVVDALGIGRENQDRIRNIAHLGVQTYGWTFINRGEAAPGPVPYVRLTAPSGAIWEWGEPSEAERVQGHAVDFAQVVTQVRNIADVSLDIRGPNATRWIAVAQCFAGPPVDPPPPGTRFRARPSPGPA
jgi:uncharacterized protein (TIGR03084 family)